MKIALIDYGVGNLRSVEKALSSVGAEVELTDNPEVIEAAEKVVLPGVGAFADGMRELKRRKLVPVLEEIARRKTPLLGICLGMQLLFEGSAEHGEHQGLGFIRGTVKRFPKSALKVPHTGWNQLVQFAETPLFHGLSEGIYAYFNHSYYCEAPKENSLSLTEYGVSFVSVVGKEKLYGVQFHPEKSQHVGLTMLKNFVESC